MSRGIVIALLATLLLGCNSTRAEPNSPSVDLMYMYSRPHARELQVFCKTYKLQYNTEAGFSDVNIQRSVKLTKFLEDNGYISNRQFTASPPLSKYEWTPTEKLWALADRRDENGCFFARPLTKKNVRVVREERHPKSDRVAIVYLSYEAEYSKYDLVILPAKGYPTTGERRVRSILLKDIFTGSWVVMAGFIDEGTASGWFTDTVPRAIEAVSIGGAEALERR